MHKKLIITVAVIIALVGVGFVVYQTLVPAQDQPYKTSTTTLKTLTETRSESTSSEPPTEPAEADTDSQWKIYSNSRLGLEFKYPAQWRKIERDSVNQHHKLASLRGMRSGTRTIVTYRSFHFTKNPDVSMRIVRTEHPKGRVTRSPRTLVGIKSNEKCEDLDFCQPFPVNSFINNQDDLFLIDNSLCPVEFDYELPLPRSDPKMELYSAITDVSCADSSIAFMCLARN